MSRSDGTLESSGDSTHACLRVDVTKKQIYYDDFAVPNVDPNLLKLPPAKRWDNFDIALKPSG